VGIELVSKAAHEAQKRLDRMIIGDIESLQLEDLSAEFDAILLADVLEHLVDPWRTIKNLATVIKTNGLVVASIPNVRYWRVTLDLLFKGKWEYGSFGILDQTHLRFFTKAGIAKLFENSGLSIEKWSHDLFQGKTKYFNALTLGKLQDHLIRQYFIRARKKEWN